MNSVNFSLRNEWLTGFTADMFITNNDDTALNGWTLEFESDFDITHIWGAEIVSHEGNNYVIKNLSWNAYVPPDETISFGFNGNYSGQLLEPINYILNGEALDSPVSLPAISINDVSVTEGDTGNTFATFDVHLSEASNDTVTFSYTTEDNTASAGSDYNSTSGTVTFAPGQTTQTISIPIAGDTLDENNETFAVNLSQASNATITDAQGVGTIVDDDNPPVVLPELSIHDVTITEGDNGTSNAVFSVTLSSATAQTVTVKYNTSNGTAVAGSDYNSTSGTVTFAPDQTTQTISIPIAGDTLDENNETFAVNLSNPSQATIADPRGVATIIDDDQTATNSPITVDFFVSHDWGIGFTGGMTITNDGNSSLSSWALEFDTPFSIYQIWGANISSQQGDHYIVNGSSWNSNLPPGGSISFGFNANYSGQISAPINYSFNGETLDSPVSLPAISINDVSVTEGDIGNTFATFDVHLSEASNDTVTVSYTTEDNTASAGSDYNSNSGTVTFAPGQTTQTISVAITDDTLNENNETFAVNLSQASNATIADGQGIGTIIDDDDPPVVLPELSINDVTITEGDNGTSNAVFTVTLSSAIAQQVTVDYNTTNGTATAGADYNSTSGTITFAPNTTSQTITVEISGDTTDENNENFVVNLSNPTQATIADGQGIGTIIDDDDPPVVLPELSINDVTITEGDNGTSNAVFTVTLSSAIEDQQVTVDYNTTNGTATAGVDYNSTFWEDYLCSW